jgi:hypothetical protein
MVWHRGITLQPWSIEVAAGSQLGPMRRRMPRIDDNQAVARLVAMTKATSPETRKDGLWRMTQRAQRRRSAPARLLPLIRPLLDDPDEAVRSEVVHAFRRCGSATMRYADDISRVAERYPQTAGSTGFTPEYYAVGTLMLLGDARWVDPVCAATAAPHPNLLPATIPCNPDVFDRVSRRLTGLVASRPDHPAIPLLARALGSWGADAAAAAPALLAALPDPSVGADGFAVARALVRIGCDDPALVPHLRALLAVQRDDYDPDPFDVEAAHAIWRLAHDARPLAELLGEVLDGHGPSLLRTGHHTAVADVGRELRELVPQATRHLTGASAETGQDPELQILAARLVWVATGDPTRILPTVRALLAGGDWPALSAAGLVADLADGAGDLADLVPDLRTLLRDPLVRADAARALWRLGAAPSNLSATLVDPIEEGWHDRGDRISTLVEMGAVEAIPRLEDLANRDKRVVDSGLDDDIVWDDEALQVRLREAVAALRSSRRAVPPPAVVPLPADVVPRRAQGAGVSGLSAAERSATRGAEISGRSSLLQRYLNGEHELVWDEIRQLGPVPDALRAEVDAVATETMRRVAAHVRRLAEALTELGLVRAADVVPLYCPPTAEELADLDVLDQEIGGLPSALRACLREVGMAHFIGDCPVLGLAYHGEPDPQVLPEDILPDPLCLPNVEDLRAQWDEQRDVLEPEEPFEFMFAPDEQHKANYSGSAQYIELPQTVADPVLHEAWPEGVTLVEYLRSSIAWGGCPGWASAPAARVPAALEALRRAPDF